MAISDLDRDLTACAVRLVTGATGAGVTQAERIAAGRMTWKIAVTTDRDKAYIVRFYPPGRHHVADYEPGLLVRMREHNMAVPPVIAMSGRESDLPCVIYERIAGRTLGSAMPNLNDRCLTTVCAAVAAQLDLLSQLPVVGFGELKSPCAGREATWLDVVRAAAGHPLTTATTDSGLLERARTALLTIASRRMSATGPSLVWTDISPENVIVGADGSFEGLIDFEGTMALEPAATLGYLQARYDGTRFWRAFRGFIPLAGQDERLPAFYTVLRALRIQPYLTGALPTGRARDPLDEFLPGLRKACEDVIEWGAINHGDGA